MQQQIDAYLSQGGQVQRIPNGVSGRDNPLKSLPTPVFDQPKSERTPIPEVLAALEARRRKNLEPVKRQKKKPAQQIVYDDFGEPLRKVWVDK